MDKHYTGYVADIIHNGRRTIKGNWEIKFKLAAVTRTKRRDGTWQSRTDYRTVVVYNDLAYNLNATFARHPKGGVDMRVIVIGDERTRSLSVAGTTPLPDIVANFAGPDLRYNVAGLGASIAPSNASAADADNLVPA